MNRNASRNDEADSVGSYLDSYIVITLNHLWWFFEYRPQIDWFKSFSKLRDGIFYRVIRMTATVTAMTAYDSMENNLSGSVDCDYRF